MTVRVLIVDDSAFFREVLRAVLEAHGIQVVGEAGDGARALELVTELAPDVVTMDVVMPLVGGIDAVRAIMSRRPTPIILLSRLAGADQALALQAMAAGALDVFEKPASGFTGALAERLAQLLRVAAAAGVRAPAEPRPREARRQLRPRITGLVASTGGPAVLRDLLAALPRELETPILIVQHTIPGFVPVLASWLGETSTHPVEVASECARLGPGAIAIAPSDSHLCLAGNGTLHLSGEAALGGHRPSGTVLLRSLAQAHGPRALAVVLTGMGRDGADGARAVADAGGTVVVQDPRSAAVDAMPRSALAAVPGAIVAAPAQLPALLAELERGGLP